MNAQQAKKQRERVLRELAQDQRRAARARIKDLGDRLRHAKRERRRRVKYARGRCKAVRKEVREQANAIRARHRAAARDEIIAVRTVANSTCAVATTKALDKAERSAQRAGAALDAERAYQATVMRGAQRKPRPTGADVRRAARERMHESDEQVAVNLPEELLPVWRERASKTKPTDRATRTEVFLDWAHNHSADVARIISRDVDAQIRELEREERTLRRGRFPRPRSSSIATLEAAPF